MQGTQHHYAEPRKQSLHKGPRGIRQAKQMPWLLAGRGRRQSLSQNPSLVRVLLVLKDEDSSPLGSTGADSKDTQISGLWHPLDKIAQCLYRA